MLGQQVNYANYEPKHDVNKKTRKEHNVYVCASDAVKWRGACHNGKDVAL
jgi:hypothetical protein